MQHKIQFLKEIKLCLKGMYQKYFLRFFKQNMKLLHKIANKLCTLLSTYVIEFVLERKQPNSCIHFCGWPIPR